MAFAPHPVTTDDIINYLTAEHGETVGTQQLLNAAEHFNCSFATVKKRLKDYKAGIGKWHLTVQEVREQLETVVKQTESLIPSKDANMYPLATLQILRRLLNPRFSTQLLLLDFLETAKRSESSKHVPNSDVS